MPFWARGAIGIDLGHDNALVPRTLDAGSRGKGEAEPFEDIIAFFQVWPDAGFFVFWQRTKLD